VYDPHWYDLNSSSNYGGAVLVLGHEVGHHVCGHRGYSKTDAEGNRRQELEADRYLGAAVRKNERSAAQIGMSLAYTISDVIEAAERSYSAEGSQTHPPRVVRIAAIWDGYNHGSPCTSRGLVKPRELTPTEQEGIAREADKELKKFCMEQVRKWCEGGSDLHTQVVIHDLMSSNCDIPKVKSGAWGTAFPGADCRGGGRFTAGRFKTP
jgi:hypothetical protein